MKIRTRMTADARKINILTVASEIANECGLINVSYLTIEPQCDNITARGIRHHYPNKTVLYEALVGSGLLSNETLRDARKIGLIK